VWYDSKLWEVIPSFPSFDTDILLYFSLMGTNAIAAFYSDFRRDDLTVNRLSFREAYDIHCKARKKNYSVSMRNRNALSNDGTVLEGLLCAGVCAASHLNGYAGMNGRQFLEHFIYQCFNDRGNIQRDGEFESIIANLESKTIPFMSPPDQSFPPAIKDVFEKLKIDVGFLSRPETISG
jgi:hypothetical protein